MDITPLLSYLRSTSNLALSCKGFAWRVRSNGFPIRTSKAELCPETYGFYKLLDYPNLDEWIINAFLEAIQTDNSDRLLSLLQTNIEAKNKDGDTALILAAREGNTDCLELLLEHKANIEAKTNFGSTALMRATGEGYPECLKILLQHKANIQVKNDYESTPLIWATWRGNIECLKLLLQHNANIEAKTNDGETSLMWAARWNKTDCLKILLQGGAKVEPGLREEYPQYAGLWGDSTL